MAVVNDHFAKSEAEVVVLMMRSVPSMNSTIPAGRTKPRVSENKDLAFAARTGGSLMPPNPNGPASKTHAFPQPSRRQGHTQTTTATAAVMPLPVVCFVQKYRPAQMQARDTIAAFPNRQSSTADFRTVSGVEAAVKIIPVRSESRQEQRATLELAFPRPQSRKVVPL
jgi:hypothetical protein